jgi:hypothetical protein
MPRARRIPPIDALGSGAERTHEGRIMLRGGVRWGTVLLVLLLLGGAVGQAEADDASGGWRKGMTMAEPRGGHTVTTLRDGRVLIVGNGDFDSELDAERVEILDPRTGSVTDGAPLRDGRLGHASVLLNDGTVLVVGGFRYGAGYVARAERYDPLTNRWSAAGALRQPRGIPSAALLADGRVLVAGGHTGQSPPDRTVEVYDPVTNSWSQAADAPASFTLGALVALPDGSVLAVGGYGDPDTSLRYDAVADRWTPAATPLRPRGGYTSTLLPDGRVLFVGGGERNWTDLYDPVTDVWSAAAPLPTAVTGHRTVLLSDGRVLVTGGFEDYPDMLPTTYLRDPDSGEWSAGPPLRIPRAGHAASALPDGGAVVVGGTRYGYLSDVEADETEIFHPTRAPRPRLEVAVPDVAHAIGTTVTVTARLRDDEFAEPLRAEFVRFSVLEGNVYDYGGCDDYYACRSDDDGMERYTYTGSGAGTDLLRVWVDLDRDFDLDALEPTQDVRIIWTAPATVVTVDPLFAPSRIGGGRVRELRASLATQDGAPVPFEELVFYAGEEAVCTAVTDEDGVARCINAVGKVRAATSQGYRVVFAGSAQYAASEGRGTVLGD